MQRFENRRLIFLATFLKHCKAIVMAASVMKILNVVKTYSGIFQAYSSIFETPLKVDFLALLKVFNKNQLKTIHEIQHVTTGKMRFNGVFLKAFF